MWVRKTYRSFWFSFFSSWLAILAMRELTFLTIRVFDDGHELVVTDLSLDLSKQIVKAGVVDM